MFMIYKVVLRKESLEHRTQKIKSVFTISFSGTLENYCYTKETKPMVQYRRPQQSFILSQVEGNLSVKFKTAEPLLGIPLGYEEIE